jgi:pSer/pThr/pTyr-binding forkhead associated (FHA) protein
VLIRLIPLDGGAPIEFELREGRAVIIGRSPTVDVYLPDLSVGRMAVRLTLQEDGVHIEDLRSGGGSAVDGVERYCGILRDGATLRIGAVVTSARLPAP